MTTKDAADATDVDETETEKVIDESIDDATETDDAATETETQSEKRMASCVGRRAWWWAESAPSSWRLP